MTDRKGGSGIAGAALAALLVLFNVSCTVKWKGFTCTEGGYSVIFPGEPSKDVTSIPSPAGTVKMVLYEANPRLNLQCAVMYLDLPPGASFDEDGAYQGMTKTMAEKWKGKVTVQQPVTLYGYSGRDVVFDTSQGNATVRLFRADQRIYMIAMLHGRGDDYKEERNKYFESFKLLGR